MGTFHTSSRSENTLHHLVNIPKGHLLPLPCNHHPMCKSCSTRMNAAWVYSVRSFLQRLLCFLAFGQVAKWDVCPEDTPAMFSCPGCTGVPLIVLPSFMTYSLAPSGLAINLSVLVFTGICFPALVRIQIISAPQLLHLLITLLFCRHVKGSSSSMPSGMFINPS